jgi:hypothetical protein
LILISRHLAPFGILEGPYSDVPFAEFGQDVHLFEPDDQPQHIMVCLILKT